MAKAPKAAHVPSAAIRGDLLVLSLPDAKTPVVWQFDLSSVKASALEVNTDGADSFALRLKTPRGEVHDIAVYASRDQAVDVLAIVHRAMTSSLPVTSSGANDDTSSGSRHLPLAVAAVVLLVGLVWAFSVLSPAPQTIPDFIQSTQPAAGPSMKSGVPQSADDILGGGAN